MVFEVYLLNVQFLLFEDIHPSKFSKALWACHFKINLDSHEDVSGTNVADAVVQ